MKHLHIVILLKGGPAIRWLSKVLVYVLDSKQLDIIKRNEAS